MDQLADTAPGVREGLEGTVSAAWWWGFDPEDATPALQACLESGARTIVVPAIGRPWVTRPLSIRSHTTLVLQEGVQILSRKGDFRNGDSSLFTLKDVEDVAIYGYRARLTMRKVDYRQQPYKKSEWRHAIEMYGCSRISVLGLSAESSGGDGVYLGRGERQSFNSDVLLRGTSTSVWRTPPSPAAPFPCWSSGQAGSAAASNSSTRRCTGSSSCFPGTGWRSRGTDPPLVTVFLCDALDYRYLFPACG
jgi:hypothetical protein